MRPLRAVARWYARNATELALIMWVEAGAIGCLSLGWLLRAWVDSR